MPTHHFSRQGCKVASCAVDLATRRVKPRTRFDATVSLLSLRYRDWYGPNTFVTRWLSDESSTITMR